MSKFTGIYIDIKSVSKKTFNISQREHAVAGTCFLITPNHDKHIWLQNELHLRSLLVSLEGEIICSGLPKFRNYGEDQGDDTAINKLISSGKVEYSEKVDGSLIIRTIISGQVCLRTRGSHHLGEFEKPIMDLINSKYPNILNPKLFPDCTCLFEYVSPNNQIVVKYQDSALVALGSVLYRKADKYPTFHSGKDYVTMMSAAFGTSHVKFYTFPKNTGLILETIKKWKDVEGIVVWGKPNPNSEHCPILSKMKTEEYIRIHSMKFQITPYKLQEFCWVNKCQSLDEAKTLIQDYGVDYEFVSHHEPHLINYFNRLEAAKEVLKSVREFTETIRGLPNRREVAFAIKDKYTSQFEFNLAINLFDNKEKELNYLIGGYVLEVSATLVRHLEKKERQPLYIPKDTADN